MNIVLPFKGLEYLYQILNQGAHEMRVDMEDWASVIKFAKYSTFSIGPEADKYRLTIAGWSGDAVAGNSFYCFVCLFVCLFLLFYVPSQQLWSLRDGQFT